MGNKRNYGEQEELEKQEELWGTRGTMRGTRETRRTIGNKRN